MNLEKLFNIFAGIFVACVVGFIVTLRVLGSNGDFAKKEAQFVHVKPGMTTAGIAAHLHELQLVKNPDAFRIEARFYGLAEKLQAGMYKIEGGSSNNEIINEFVKGRIELVDFIVPEGFNVVKTAKKIEALGIGKADKFIAAAKNYAPYEYMQTNNPNVVYKAEGFLYPASYKFAYGSTEAEILALLVKQFNDTMVKSGVMQTVAERKLNLRDVVNMAAMVEMEAVFRDEQPRIAGVFLKRVKIDMPIQSDTTIQYILGTQKEIVTYKDLEINNPYNTYKYYGLPPGPIASPSLSAIKAVLEPEEHEYLYFVAERDGHHRFSRTYGEHLRAINDIQNGR